jgi:hypothetical protein
MEESHNAGQLAHLSWVLTRHSRLFYPYRSQFAHHVINSLTRLGVGGTFVGSVTETRRLALGTRHTPAVCGRTC